MLKADMQKPAKWWRLSNLFPTPLFATLLASAFVGGFVGFDLINLPDYNNMDQLTAALREWREGQYPNVSSDFWETPTTGLQEMQRIVHRSARPAGWDGRTWNNYYYTILVFFVGLILYYSLLRILHSHPRALGVVLSDRRFQSVAIIYCIASLIWCFVELYPNEWNAHPSEFLSGVSLLQVFLFGAAAAGALLRWGFSVRE